MGIITGGKIIEGSSPGLKGNVAVPSSSMALWTSPGLPASGYLNTIVPAGGYVVRTDTGRLYENTGTQAATVWTDRGLIV